MTLGVLALLPTVATIYILKLLFGFIDPVLGIAFSQVLVWLGLVQFPLQVGGILFQSYIPGVGLILTLILLILVGMMTQSLFGKQVFRFTEHVFFRVPLARSIYSTTQQIINAYVRDSGSFKQVVMVQYPRKGLYTLGFMTGESNGEVQVKTKERVLNIFLPTTPNPTSGWLVLVPEKDVVFLNMSVEDGLKYIISGGVVVPPWSGLPDEEESTSLVEAKHLKVDRHERINDDDNAQKIDG